jgi:hypothetical protein
MYYVIKIKKYFCLIIILFLDWERNKIFTLLLLNTFEDGVNEIFSHIGDKI